MTFELSTPLTALPGIGPQRATLLARLGLQTLDDVLHYLPERYEDRRHLTPLSDAQEGQLMTVRAKVHRARAQRWHQRRVFEAVLAPQPVQSHADVLLCRWFGRYDLEKKLSLNRELFVYGKVKKNKKGGWEMNPTDFELIDPEAESHIHLDRIAPIYRLTEGLYQGVMRRLMFEITQKLVFDVPEIYPAPPDLPARREAFRIVHFPDSLAEQERARQRLAYDEFLLIQCVVAQRRLHRITADRPRPRAQAALAETWLKSLPFTPTSAQNRVMQEILHDLTQGPPMNRLLQGDVGSGKTLVAVHAMLLAVERGEQAALMAPTQILAEQHALNLRRWLQPLGIEIELFTGTQKSTRLQKLQGSPDLFAPEAYRRGQIGSIIIGTHALLYERYAARKLGLIVIDEQHKFGVLQRLALSRKGENPDILVMTATPIPRTLGMTLYGDLDISILNELPPGRQPILTARRSPAQLEAFWKFLRKQVGEGRQAYIIYPLVEDSEKVEAKSVKAEYERLKDILPDIRLGLLHGQLPAPEKERVMQAFRQNEIQVLLATTVVEVGVDVPNATVMLIENAERFGLAQLHQLRGRIGRGAHASYCCLMGEPKSAESWLRLKVMEETNDGFRIAEEDLRIRGAGNIFGTEQSGLPPLLIGDLVNDYDLLARAKRQADQLVKDDPTLSRWTLLRERISRSVAGRVSLVAVS